MVLQNHRRQETYKQIHPFFHREGNRGTREEEKKERKKKEKKKKKKKKEKEKEKYISPSQRGNIRIEALRSVCCLKPTTLAKVVAQTLVTANIPGRYCRCCCPATNPGRVRGQRVLFLDDWLAIGICRRNCRGYVG